LQFSPPQRNMVVQAMDEAEERTTGYYCIPPFRWQRYPYDLLTRADHEWQSLPESVFASVQCLRRIVRGLPSDFYRIQLNDQSILTAAQRENLNDLYPFLVYILTHEMVHLVRLTSILDDSVPTASDPSEENRVQLISRRILAGSPQYQPVLDRFCASHFASRHD
jgi:hypothetical protein